MTVLLLQNTAGSRKPSSPRELPHLPEPCAAFCCSSGCSSVFWLVCSEKQNSFDWLIPGSPQIHQSEVNQFSSLNFTGLGFPISSAPPGSSHGMHSGTDQPPQVSHPSTCLQVVFMFKPRHYNHRDSYKFLKKRNPQGLLAPELSNTEHGQGRCSAAGTELTAHRWLCRAAGKTSLTCTEQQHHVNGELFLTCLQQRHGVVTLSVGCFDT